MEGWGQLLLIVVLFILPTLLGAGRKKPRPEDGAGRPRRPRPPVRPASEGKRRLEAQARPGGAGPPPLDATQQEGTLLERLLREIEGDLGQIPAPVPSGPARRPIPAARENDEGVSLETGGERGPRARVDQDESAEAVARRRIEEAGRRNTALSDQDHAEFEARIKREEAAAGAPAGQRVRLSGNALRDAFVWREILGPPMAMRDDREW